MTEQSLCIFIEKNPKNSCSSLWSWWEPEDGNFAPNSVEGTSSDPFSLAPTPNMNNSSLSEFQDNPILVLSCFSRSIFYAIIFLCWAGRRWRSSTFCLFTRLKFMTKNPVERLELIIKKFLFCVFCGLRLFFRCLYHSRTKASLHPIQIDYINAGSP